MNRHVLISDEQIQDFIDDRLERPARSAVTARLRACPELGAEVEAMRRQQRALRQIGQEILYEPVPSRLRGILWQDRGGARDSVEGDDDDRRTARQAQIFGLTAATAAILTGCVGSGFTF